jgi:hypothetical protein
MNSPLAVESARALAELAARAEPGDETRRVDFLWRRAFGRAPRASERDRALEFVHASRARVPSSSDAAIPTAGQRDASAPQVPVSPSDVERTAWSALAQTLLVSNEFLYLD